MFTHENLPYAIENCQNLINLHGPTYFTLNDLKFMGILARHSHTKSIIIDVAPWLLMPLANEDLQINFERGRCEDYSII